LVYSGPAAEAAAGPENGRPDRNRGFPKRRPFSFCGVARSRRAACEERGHGVVMDLEISDTLRNRLLGRIDADSPLGRRLSECAVYHGRSIVPSKLFDTAALDLFHDLCKAAGERTTMLQIAALRRIRSEPAGIGVDNL